MLIVTRRVDESIVIDDNIVVTVLAVNGKQLRIGVSAPDDVSIDREEVYESKGAERSAGLLIGE